MFGDLDVHPSMSSIESTGKISKQAQHDTPETMSKRNSSAETKVEHNPKHSESKAGHQLDKTEHKLDNVRNVRQENIANVLLCVLADIYVYICIYVYLYI